MTKEVAIGSVMAAVINIVVNVFLIKYIGLYAAAISTAVAYFVMMMHRHIDLKKYVTITYEKGLFIKIILIFTFSIVLYYQHNLILNIINLVIVCLFAFFSNKEFLLGTYKTIIGKLKHNK